MASQVALQGALSGTTGGAFSAKGEGFIAECRTHHHNGQRAAMISGNDADSDMGHAIGDDRITVTEEHMFAYIHVFFNRCPVKPPLRKTRKKQKKG